MKSSRRSFCVSRRGMVANRLCLTFLPIRCHSVIHPGSLGFEQALLPCSWPSFRTWNALANAVQFIRWPNEVRNLREARLRAQYGSAGRLIAGRLDCEFMARNWIPTKCQRCSGVNHHLQPEKAIPIQEKADGCWVSNQRAARTM